MPKLIVKVSTLLKLNEAETQQVQNALAQIDLTAFLSQLLGGETVGWKEELAPLLGMAKEVLLPKLVVKVSTLLKLNEAETQQVQNALDQIDLTVFLSQLLGGETVGWKEELAPLLGMAKE